MNTVHHKVPDGLMPMIISFMQQLRKEGLNVGIQEAIDSLMASGTEILQNRNRFKITLRAICCCSPEEIALFDRVFEQYWKHDKLEHTESFRKIVNPLGLVNEKNASLVLMGKGQSEGQESAKNISGAHDAERLRKTDFSKVSEIDSEFLDQLAKRLFREMSCRLRRRLKKNKSHSKIDFRKTFRRNIEKGGTPLQLIYKGPQLQKDKIVLFLDVSGSMDKYSFFLLRFILALKNHFKNLEVFVFSTSLLRISRMLQRNGMGRTLQELSERADAWSGGTKIGACMRDFNSGYCKYLNKRNSVVIIVSDGLDTGEPEILKQELQKIRRRSKKIIWLNPLKGMASYEPVARGMSTALPLIDEFGSAHNLDSIMKLEKYLADA